MLKAWTFNGWLMLLWFQYIYEKKKKHWTSVTPRQRLLGGKHKKEDWLALSDVSSKWSALQWREVLLRVNASKNAYNHSFFSRKVLFVQPFFIHLYLLYKCTQKKVCCDGRYNPEMHFRVNYEVLIQKLLEKFKQNGRLFLKNPI